MTPPLIPAMHLGRHPMDLDAADVTAFLSDLAVVRRVSASTQNQALAALMFLYAKVLRRPLVPLRDVARAKVTRRLPVVLSVDEVRRVIARLGEPARLVVTLLYGSGLRINECVSLRIKDIDCERREIVVRREGRSRSPCASGSVGDSGCPAGDALRLRVVVAGRQVTRGGHRDR